MVRTHGTDTMPRGLSNGGPIVTPLIRAAVLACLTLPLPALSQQEAPRVPAIQESAKHPGYGTVEKVQEVRVMPERSAAAGGSAPAKGASDDDRPAYRVTVRMADGSTQQRDLYKPEFKPGDDVLLTNAGEIVRD